MSNGYQIIDVTAHKVDRIRGLVPTGAAVENETYYLSFKPGLFPSNILFPSDILYPDKVEGTGLVEQGLISLDFKRGNQFSYKMVKYDEIRSIGIVDSNLHLGTGGYDNVDTPCDEIMFRDCLSFLNCTPFELSVMNLYQEQGLSRLYYTSPRFMDGGKSTLKQYDKIRLSCKGVFKIRIQFSESNNVITREIETIGDEESSHVIGIPNKNNNSYWIQFFIEGVGILSSLQYSWKPREVVN